MPTTTEVARDASDGLGQAFDALASTLKERPRRARALLEARGLVRTRGAARLLDGVDLRAEAGELIALLGCSGAGKSTLLRALAGCEPLDAGQVRVGGAPLEPGGAQASYLPQDDLLHGGLTPRETLELAARLRLPAAVTADARARRVARTLQTLGLEACQDRLVRDLSGGQRKRVALGAELLAQPRVLLLDEPNASLDPALRGRTFQLFRRLADAGRVVIVATHDPTGLEHCDRLVALHAGRVVAAGSPAEVRSRFQLDRLEQLWDHLPQAAASRLVRSPRAAAASRAPARRSGSGRRGPAHALALMTRELRLLARDRRRLALLSSQAILIGLAIGAALEAPALLLFMLVLAALWCGTSGGARELVKERALRQQERRAGVGVAPYLGAKVGLQLVLALAQAGLLLGSTALLRELPGRASWLYAVLALTAWVGGLSGLALSSLTRTPDRAQVLVPLALIPQVLFAGVFATSGDLAQVLGRALPARWAYDLALRATLQAAPDALVTESQHDLRTHRLELGHADLERGRQSLEPLAAGLDGDDPGTQVEIALDTLRVRQDRLEDRAAWAREGLDGLESRQAALGRSSQDLHALADQLQPFLENPTWAWFGRPPAERGLEFDDWIALKRREVRQLQDGFECLETQTDAFEVEATETRKRLARVDDAAVELRQESEHVDAVWGEAELELRDLQRRARRWQREAQDLSRQAADLDDLRRTLEADVRDSRVVRLEPAGSLGGDVSLLTAFALVFLGLTSWRLRAAA